MLTRRCRLGWVGLWCVALLAGCSASPTSRPAGDEEGAVRAKFTELQTAVRQQDAEKIWSLMDSKSRAEAERLAQDVRDAQAKADAEDKAKQAKELGLTEAELAGLTGQGFLKSKRFQRKYHQLPDSKVEKVTVQGDNATVYYLEPDGDKEKLIFVRQDGQWKAWLALPKGGKP